MPGMQIQGDLIIHPAKAEEGRKHGVPEKTSSFIMRGYM
jgi:hypothetical protein